MRDIYLGDSYDLVKRFWFENLLSVAPLYAHSRFVPPGIRVQYTAVTSIPILDPGRLPDGRYALLLDPHVGIPLPSERTTKANAAHAPLDFIVQVNQQLRPTYMICFDQSYHRRHELSRPDQREKKRLFLQDRGIGSFYYVSHAPFLFMAGKPENVVVLFRHLISLGIPQSRFEPTDESSLTRR